MDREAKRPRRRRRRPSSKAGPRRGLLEDAAMLKLACYEIAYVDI